VGGHGLAGMRERVAGLGGEVSAGPAGDHLGWRVRARIPYGEGGA
jgi:signal transduction histidine kinase